MVEKKETIKKKKRVLTEEQKKRQALNAKKRQVRKVIDELKSDMKVYSQLSEKKFNKALKEELDEIFNKYGDVLMEVYKDDLINELKEMKPKKEVK